MADSILRITLCDDGTIKTDARKVRGSEKEVLGELEKLASTVGGVLRVEKHEPGAHHHHGAEHGHHHSH